MQPSTALTCLIYDSVFRYSVVAFVPTFPIAGDHQHTSPARVIVRPQSNPLSAVVFYPDDFDEDADDKNYDNIFGFSSEPNPTEAVFAQLADKLSKDPENVSKLALIAAAFSPRGYEINMAHINQIGCLTVDNRHLDIEVVVCDQGDCNSLLIPVHFKNECDMNDLGGLEDCVLKNVDILNRESEELVMARKEETFEDAIGAQRALDVLSSLGSAPPKVMPDWWIYPRLSEESEECDLIQDLLNGRDLEEMVRGLAMAIELQNESRNIVQSAIVRDIGPAGIVLQAQVEDMFKDVVLMEIPIPFASGPVELNDGLRSIRDEVLGMVSASEVLLEKHALMNENVDKGKSSEMITAESETITKEKSKSISNIDKRKKKEQKRKQKKRRKKRKKRRKN